MLLQLQSAYYRKTLLDLTALLTQHVSGAVSERGRKHRVGAERGAVGRGAESGDHRNGFEHGAIHML